MKDSGVSIIMSSFWTLPANTDAVEEAGLARKASHFLFENADFQ